MRKLTITMALLAVAALGFSGCSREVNPVAPAAPAPNFGYVLPEGATLTQAVLNLHVVDPSYQTVGVYRLTRDWEETTVTWNNFNLYDGGAYVAPATASFVADMNDAYASVDVTAQVMAWMAGEEPNFGFLLKQPVLFSARTEMFSRERGEDPPFLEIVYTLNGETVYVELAPLADATIHEQDPDTAFGLYDKLYSGWRNGLEKVSLIRFDLDVQPPDEDEGGCSLTIGFWKTHCGFGPQADEVTPLLGNGIWLGNPAGPKSLAVTDRTIARNVLRENVYGTASNGITKLYAQLLGTKLNVANGADDDAVAAAIAAADAFLATHNYMDWSGLSEADQAQVLAWKDTFDDYNNGEIGPGHCGDE